MLTIAETDGFSGGEIRLNEVFRFQEEKREGEAVQGSLVRCGELIHTEKCVRAGYVMPHFN